MKVSFMKLKKIISKETSILALCIALLPPIWAVISSHIGISTGAVSLICAGIYVSNGNKTRDAIKITIGFLLGVIWGFIALNFVHLFTTMADLALFIILFLLGGLAVIVPSMLPKYIHSPSWLSGLAITMLILGNAPVSKWGSTMIEISVSMIVGVYYVGIGVSKFQKLLCK
jgi:hypothetical protein